MIPSILLLTNILTNHKVIAIKLEFDATEERTFF